MAEKIKRVKASKIPIATELEGFTAFGVRVNADGTIDNVRTPMALLKGNSIPYDSLTEAEKAAVKFKFSDLSASEKDELTLKWEHITPEQKDELSLKYNQLTSEQKDELRGEDGYTPIKDADYFDGIDGLTPEIGENDNWWIGDVDTGVKAIGQTFAELTPAEKETLKGITPHIGVNLNWFIDNEDTGVLAEGKDGDDANVTKANVETALGYTVNSSVPANAKFTDTNTVTSINGKTGVIAKADIVALGIPAQDTVVDISGKADKTYVDDKVKTDVPANAKFTDTVVSVSHLLPKSGGTIENYVEKLVVTTGVINLNDGNVFHRNAAANTTFSITNAKAGAHSFTLIITMGATVRTLTFPASVKWQDGKVPEMTEANKTYILTFMTINSGTTWFGMEGGSF